MKYFGIKRFIQVLYSKTWCSLRDDKRFSSDLRFNSIMHVSVMVALSVIPFVSVFAISLNSANIFGDEIFVWSKRLVIIFLIVIPIIVWRITRFSEHEAQQIWNETPSGMYKWFVEYFSWLVMAFLIITTTLIVVT